MNRKLILALVLIGTLIITGGSFAYTQTSESVSTNVTSGSFSSTTAWSSGVAWDKYGAMPDWTPVEGAAGSVTAGDLYYVQNPSGYTGKILVMLYFTNVGDLAKCYTYLNMKVQAYDYASAGTWTSEALDSYLTLGNGYVSFILDQAAGDGYAITVDGGSWYCFDADGGSLSPSFYIEVIPAAA